MKRLAVLVGLAVLLAGIVLFGVSAIALSIADTTVPGSEVTSNEANNASATAGIRITMTGVIDE